MKSWFALAATLFVTPAFAHAMLEKASPAAGVTVHKAPSEIVLTFSEALEPTFSSVSVKAPNGRVIASGAQANGQTMRVPLKTIGPGLYRVIWQAVSVDSHRTEGNYTFTLAP